MPDSASALVSAGRRVRHARGLASDAPTGEPARIRIAFLTRSLEYGGAERQLVVLARGLHERGHDVAVVAFYPNGPLEAELRAAGVRVRDLFKGGRWEIVRFVRRLARVVGEERPDVVHGYLHVPNIFATVLRALRPALGFSVVWGVRASRVDPNHYDWTTRLVEWLTRLVCRVPRLIIVNSRSGFEHATDLGYPRDAMLVVPNGIDTERFAPEPTTRRQLRDEWGVGDDEQLVGLVGRIDPAKDHATFLAAAGRLAETHANVRFVCVGSGDALLGQRLRALATGYRLDGRLSWVPSRSDMPAVYRALDVACCSSTSEGFPNVVAEAMACGVPCIVTDVGDSAWLVGDSRLVVPPRSPDALAERIAWLLDADEPSRTAIAARGRRRVIDQFSVSRMLDSTEAALQTLTRAARS